MEARLTMDRSYNFKGGKTRASLEDSFRKLQSSEGIHLLTLDNPKLPKSMSLAEFLNELPKYLPKTIFCLQLIHLYISGEAVIALISLMKRNGIEWLSFVEVKRDEGVLEYFLNLFIEEGVDLHGLGLGSLKLTMEEAENIGYFLSKSPFLLRLIIFDLRFKNEEAKYILKGLETNLHLREINIELTSVTSDIVNECVTLFLNGSRLERILLPTKIDTTALEFYLERSKKIALVAKIATALIGGERVSLMRSKLMVIGNGQAGKTSTINSLLHRYEKDVKSTIVANSKEAAIVTVKSELTNNWSSVSASTEQHLATYDLKSVIKTHADNDIVLDNLNISEPLSDDSMNQIVNDLSTTVVTMQAEEKRAENTKGMELNYQQEGMKLVIWDFGGQEVFYSLHHLFLTNHGAYILVFRLDRFLSSSSEIGAAEYEKKAIAFWVSSLKMHAPEATISVVGTHFDVVNNHFKTKYFSFKKGKKSGRNNLLKFLLYVNEVLEELLAGVKLVVNDHSVVDVPLLFFTVDNSSLKKAEETVDLVRKSVEEQVRNELTAARQIKLSYVYFMDALFARNQPVIELGTILEIAKEIRIAGEVPEILEYYKSVGLIFHFSEGNFESDILSEVVVLQPQWLLQCLAKVLFEPKVHMKVVSASLSISGKMNLQEYSKTGILHYKLLSELLEDQDEKMRSFLIALCLRMLLFSVYSLSDNVSSMPLVERSFIVPSMLPEVKLHEDLNKKTNVVLKLESYLAKGIYERVISIVMNKAYSIGEKAEPLLSKHWSYCAVNSFKYKEVEEDLQFYVVSEPAMKQIRFFAVKERMLPFLTLFVSEVVSLLKEDPVGKKTVPTLFLPVHFEDKSLLCPYDSAKMGIENETIRVKWTNDKGIKEEILTKEFLCYFEPRFYQTESNIKAIPSQTPNQPDERFDVFLAHEWGEDKQNHRRVMELAVLLKEQGVKVWVDETNIGSLISTGILAGLNSSRKVVIVITRRYIANMDIHSMWCAQEFQFIMSRKRNDVILVLFDESLSNPNTWGSGEFFLRVGDSRMYVDMSSTRKMRDNLVALCDRVRE